MEDSGGFGEYMRMSRIKFNELSSIIGPSVRKKDTVMRNSIHPGERFLRDHGKIIDAPSWLILILSQRLVAEAYARCDEAACAYFVAAICRTNSNQFEFVPQFAATKFCRGDNDFHMSHEAICCSKLSRRLVAAICCIVCLGLNAANCPSNKDPIQKQNCNFNACHKEIPNFYAVNFLALTSILGLSFWFFQRVQRFSDIFHFFLNLQNVIQYVYK